MKNRCFLTSLLSMLVGAWALLHARNLEVTTLLTAPPESGIITNLVLRSSQGTFLCLPPPRWSLKLDEEGDSLTFTSSELAVIRVALAKGAPAPGSSLPNSELLRHELTRRSPKVEFLGEGTCYTEAQSGEYVDTKWQSAGGTVFCSRTAWVKVGMAWMEFELSTIPPRFAAMTAVFQDFLTSFQGYAPKL